MADRLKASNLYQNIVIWRQTSVLWMFLTEPFKFLTDIVNAIRYKSIYPLRCFTTWAYIVAMLGAVSLQILFGDIRFSLIAIPVVRVIAAGIYVKAYLPYRRYDPITKRKRSTNGLYEDKDWLNNRSSHFIKYLTLSEDINKCHGWIYGMANGYIVGRRGKSRGNNAKIGFGISGAGKGTSQVILNVLQCIADGVPFIVSSIKSDVFSETARIAEKVFENVWLFDMKDGEVNRSDGFNPLKYVKGNAKRALNLADCIVKNTSIEEKPDYWSRGETALIKSLLLWFSDIKGQDNLPAIYDFIVSCKTLSDLEAIMDNIPKDHPAYGEYAVFRFGDDRPKQQVFQGVGMRFSFLNDPDVREILKHDEIDLEKLANTKSCCYVVADKKMTLRPLTSIFFTMAFWAYDDEANKRGNQGKLKLKPRVIIDEAHATGEIPGFANTIETCRSTGLEISTFMQDLPQLKSMYPDDYITILNNCGTKMLLDTDDVDVTIPYFQKLCGTFTAMSSSRDKGEDKERLSETMVDLAPAGFLQNLGEKTVVVMSESPEPLLVDKLHYYQNMPGSKINWLNTFDDKTYHAHPMLKDYEYYDVYDKPIKYKPKEKQQKEMLQKSEPIKKEHRSTVPVSEVILGAEEL